MRSLFFRALAAAVALAGCGQVHEPGPNVGDHTSPMNTDINSRATNGVISIGSSARFAGAISSLQYNGKEFLNTWDHGRELQVAFNKSGEGECNNPTEAGSRSDGVGPFTSSVLRGFWTSDNVLASSVAPAYWMRPGETQGAGGCPVAVNQTVVAADIIYKQVEVGYDNLPNVIQFQTQLQLAADVPGGLQVEPGIAFLNAELDHFYAYDAASDALAPLPLAPGEQDQSVIVATGDGQYAMGMWAPDLPVGNSRYGEGHSDYANPAETTRYLTTIYRRDGLVPAGAYNYETFIVVGDLATVRADIHALSTGTADPREAACRAEITTAYEQYLHRDPTAADMAYHLPRCLSGIDSADEIHRNADCIAETTQAYEDFLGRAPGPGELQPWVVACLAGTDVRTAISRSPEACGRVIDGAFQTSFGRAPNATETGYYQTRCQEGIDVAAEIAAAAASRPPPPAPRVSAALDANGHPTISWDASPNPVTSCSIQRQYWGDSTATVIATSSAASGSYWDAIWPLPDRSRTYWVACTGPGGTGSNYVAVTVSDVAARVKTPIIQALNPMGFNKYGHWWPHWAATNAATGENYGVVTAQPFSALAPDGNGNCMAGSTPLYEASYFHPGLDGTGGTVFDYADAAGYAAIQAQGWTGHGVAFCILSASYAGTVPLYKFIMTTYANRAYSTDPSWGAGQPDLQRIGIVGYVYP